MASSRISIKFNNEKLGLSLVGYAADGAEIGSAANEGCAAVVVTSIAEESEAAGLPLIGLAIDTIRGAQVLGQQLSFNAVSLG
jgi:hypothetical protein